MSVEFILGRPCSRREDVIIEKIAEAAGNDPLFPVLVITPPQATYATECMIFNKLGVNGTMGIGVASISRVAQRVQEEVYGAAQQGISSAGKAMLIKQILDEKTPELKTLHKMRAQYFLLPQLADVVTEMKQLDISAEDLRGFSVENVGMAQKLEDIALIMDELAERTQGVYDTEDRLDSVIEHINDAPFIRDAHVFFHGFDMYNAQTIRFITEVMKTAHHTAISFLYADVKQADSEVYGICNENRMRFISVAKELGLETTIVTDEVGKSPDVLHIEKNIYAYPARRAGDARDIVLTRATDRKEEIDGVAAQIARLTQKEGLRFNEIAVLCGDAESYLPQIRERFARVNIPCFTGEKRGLIQSNIADFVLSALELAKGRIKKDTLLRHAATGYCNITTEQMAVVQNYAYGHIRDGFAFLKPFADEEAEQARVALVQPLEELRSGAAKVKDTAGLVRLVFDYMDTLAVREKVEDQTAKMRDRQLFECASFIEQAYEKLERALEQAGMLVGTYKGGAHLAQILKAGLSSEQLSVIPPAANEVLCGDIAGTFLPETKVLFVLGMNEGMIPNYSRKTDVLSETERDMLLSGLKGLNHTGAMDKQRLAIVKALSRPSARLYISYIDDGVMQQSSLVDRLKGIFTNIQEEAMAGIAPTLLHNAYRLTAEGIRSAADGGQVKLPPGVASAVFDVCESEQLAESEDGVALVHENEYSARMRVVEEGIYAKQEAVQISPPRARALYGAFSSSATRIENFYNCPYRHFMTYGIRANVPREYTIDQLDAGRFAHKMLDMLAREVKADGRQWAEYEKDDFSTLVKKCADTAKADDGKYRLNRHNETVLDAIGRDVENVAEMIRMQCAKGALQPSQTEIGFELPEGRLRGIVDRVDVAHIEGKDYFSIVDYKSGTRDFDLSRMAGGVDLQLVIYILAVRKLLGEDYAFAGANYMRVYSALREREETLHGLYRMRGIEGVAADVAEKLYGGDERGYLFAVDVQKKTDGEYYARSEERYFPEEKLDIVLRYTQRLIDNAAKKISNGENEIRPVYDKRSGLACKYCEYAAVCMFDRRIEDTRMIGRRDKDELLAKMRDELGEKA